MAKAGAMHAINLVPNMSSKSKGPERTNSPVGEILSIGDFRINLDQRTVCVRDKQIDLAAAEFDLLVFLVTHPKKLVTPQTMLSTHWQGNRVHQTQFLQVLLSLRKKLDASNLGLHYIRTEPWVVYQFDPLG